MTKPTHIEIQAHYFIWLISGCFEVIWS